MKLKWYGHSCFLVEHEGYSILLDPYQSGSVPGLELPALTANEVLCSHDHRDHNARELVALVPGVSPFTVTEVPAFHDHHGGAHRGEIVMRVLEAGGLRVAHLADIGQPLSEAQVQALGRLDAILLPVGGHYTVGPAEAKAIADSLGARVVVPMHYRGQGFGYPVIGELNAYLALCDNVVRYPNNTLVLTPELPRQTAVLAMAAEVLC